MDLAIAHARAGWQSFDQYLCTLCILFFHLFLRLLFLVSPRPYGFRPSLEDPDLPVSFIDAPFHIHIAAVMGFDFLGISGQFQDLLVGQGLALPVRFRHRHFFRIPALLPDQHHILFIDGSGEDLHVFFGNDVGIRGDDAAHYIFAQAPGPFDHDVLIVPVGHVHGEHDPGGLGEHHHLDHGRKSQGQMVIALLFPVIHGPVRKAGSVAFLHLGDYAVGSLDVQIGILLSGKAGIGQILRRSAGADGHIRLSFTHLGSQFPVGFPDGILEILGHFLFHDGSPQLAAHRTQLFIVLHIGKAGQQAAHFFFQPGGFDEIAVRVSRGGKAIGNRHIGLGSHFSQRRRFPSHNIHVFPFQLFEPQQICFGLIHGIRSFALRYWRIFL